MTTRDLPRQPGPSRWAVATISLATPILIVAATLLLLFNPWWITPAQDRAGVPAITGLSGKEVERITGSILSDVTLGPPEFMVGVNDQPILDSAERAHMTDVYGVLRGFGLAAILAAGLVVVILFRHRRDARVWRVTARAAGVLVLVGVLAALVVTFFFDSAFLVFHLVFFPQGNFAFDPRTQRLTQLFPTQFWTESAVAAVAIATGLAGAVFAVARRHATALTARLAGADDGGRDHGGREAARGDS